MPCWQPAGHGAAEAVKVEDLLLLVGAMLESTAAEGHTVGTARHQRPPPLGL